MKKSCFFAVLGWILAAFCSCSEKYGEGPVNFSVWYDYDGDRLPDFDTLGQPDATGAMLEFDIESVPEFATDRYAALVTSELTVDKEGEFRFYMYADDGARLCVDGECVCEINAAVWPRELVTVRLTAGRHSIRVEHFDRSGKERLRMSIGRTGELVHTYGSNDAPAKDIPDYVMDEAAVSYERFEAWKGDDEVVVFPILTDIHSHERYSYQHIGYAVKTDELFHYDFMVCLGDIGLNVGPSNVSRQYVEDVIAFTRAEMDRYKGVFLYAAGNHDWDDGQGGVHTDQFLSDTFQKPALEYADGNLHLVPGKVYCYYDVPQKNVRVVLLNSEGSRTQAPAYYLFDDEQMEWFKDLLDNTSPDTAVIVMSHYMPHPIGRWHNTPEAVTLASNERLMSVLSDYGTRRSIVGLFCGDSHVNTIVTEGGINYYITQGLGGVAVRDMMDGTTHEFFDYRGQTCCDVIAVKPALRQVRSFRIGAGGAAYDCDFVY